MTVFFTSDQHFFHKHVISYCERPFANQEEMHEALIKNYNDVVGPEDICFFLGDLSFSGKTNTRDILERLPGNKILVRGNHDNFTETKYVEIGFSAVIKSGKFEEFNLSHYPYVGEEADARRFKHQLEDHGNWLLHGHVHQHWKIKNKMINVGVDVWDYKPVSYEQILEFKRNLYWPSEQVPPVLVRATGDANV